jgi:hypothetical protein
VRRWQSLALLAGLLVLASKARGESASAIVRRSRAQPPPAEFLSSLSALQRLGYTRKVGGSNQPLAVTPECRSCEDLVLCRGLFRAYRVDLTGPARRTITVVALEHDSHQHSSHAREAFRHLNRAVLQQRERLFVGLDGHPLLAAKLADALAVRNPPGRPAAPRMPNGPQVFLDPTTPDADLRPLALAARVTPRLWRLSEQIPVQLNKRGMRFLRARKLTRAAIAFELAADLDEFAVLPFYNRACVAGLQRDAATAVLWLWKLALAHGMYGRPTGTEEGSKLLKRPRLDKDLDGIRQSDELRAFEARCRSQQL